MPLGYIFALENFSYVYSGFEPPNSPPSLRIPLKIVVGFLSLIGKNVGTFTEGMRCMCDCSREAVFQCRWLLLTKLILPTRVWCRGNTERRQ